MTHNSDVDRDQQATVLTVEFTGPVGRVVCDLRRPLGETLSFAPPVHAVEAMVTRIVPFQSDLGVELELPGGMPARAQLTALDLEELEITEGDIVSIRALRGPAVDSARVAAIAV